MQIERKSSKILKFYIPTILYLLFLLFPFYWMVNTTFKSDKELYNLDLNPFLIHSPTIHHVVKLFTETIFLRWMANTFFVALLATMISLAASLLAAYAIQRIKFRTSGPTGGGHLSGIPDSANHPVHPPGPDHIQTETVGQPLVPGPDLSHVSYSILHLAVDGVFQDHSQGNGKNAP